MLNLVLNMKNPTILNIILFVLLEVIAEAAIFYGLYYFSSIDAYFDLNLQFTDFVLVQLVILKIQSTMRGN